MPRARPLAGAGFALGQLSLLLLLGCRPSPPDVFELTLLHTNDTHARILPFNRFGTTCSEAEREAGGCFGGVARRATVIERIRAERRHVLLLDGGDQFQGTLFYNRFKGDATRLVMNHLGYDAMVVGNHEFDDGPEVLARFVEGCHFPVLGTNVEAEAGSPLDGRLLPYSLVNIGGETVGLVGYITEETRELSQPGPTVRFLDIETSVAQIVATLQGQGIDKILALSHAGHVRDLRVASDIDGIDVIIGGHTNTLLSNTEQEAEGPYPVVVEGPSGDPVLIVQDYAWGKFLGRLDVAFDRLGRLTTWSGNPILIDASVPENEETGALIAEMATEVEAFAEVVVGRSDVDLVGRAEVCRFAECNLGNLITDALLDAHPGTEIALQNSGGIRSGIAAGDVSVGHVLEVLPFGNTASTFSLAGSTLRAVLEHGVSQAEDPNNDGTGRFLQVAGMRYTWTAEADVGERVLAVEIRNPEGGFVPLDEERTYRLVSNSFTRGGGDGFAMLAEQAVDAYDQGRVLADIVQDYILERSPVHPALDGRITRR